jgi:hypothetical protein
MYDSFYIASITDRKSYVYTSILIIIRYQGGIYIVNVALWEGCIYIVSMKCNKGGNCIVGILGMYDGISIAGITDRKGCVCTFIIIM